MSFKDVKRINPYVDMMEDYSAWVLHEAQAREAKENWKNSIFQSPAPVDVEIGTGNGFHFAHYAKSQPDRSVVGFEIKFKTVVQSIARARREGCENARMIKGDAQRLSSYFSPGEVQKIMIHFPDPWPKIRQQKNRLMNREFFKDAYKILPLGGEIQIKTDHLGYFKFAAHEATYSDFIMDYYTEDLHNSFKSDENFVTQFESLFLRKGQPIFYFSLKK